MISTRMHFFSLSFIFVLFVYLSCASSFFQPKIETGEINLMSSKEQIRCMMMTRKYWNILTVRKYLLFLQSTHTNNYNNTGLFLIRICFVCLYVCHIFPSFHMRTWVVSFVFVKLDVYNNESEALKKCQNQLYYILRFDFECYINKFEFKIHLIIIAHFEILRQNE